MSVIGSSNNKRRLSQIKSEKPQKKPKPHKSQHGYRVRDKNLRALGFRSYSHYLKSSMWEEVRKLAFQKHGRKCINCGGNATEIHHSSYDLKTLVGSKLSHLHPICRDCHEAAEFDENGKMIFMAANRALGLYTPEITGNDNWMARRFLENKRLKKEKPVNRKSAKKVKVPVPKKKCLSCGHSKKITKFKKGHSSCNVCHKRKLKEERERYI